MQDANELRLAEELRGARYTSEDDFEEKVDLSFKIGALRQAIVKRKAKWESDEEISTQKKRKQSKKNYSEASPQLPIEKEALQQGVDFAVLREIKSAFDDASTKGQLGIGEEEFMEDFGPALSQGMSEEQLRLWFRTIDANASGTVSWSEVSNYLTQQTIAEEPSTRVFVPTPISAQPLDARCGNVTKRKHKLPMTRITYSPTLDAIYTGSTDGIVHCWNPATMHTLQTPIHKTNSWVNGIVYMPHNNRLAVLQADRSIFIYDAFNYKGKLCHELYRAFATQGKAVRQSANGGTFYDGRLSGGAMGRDHSILENEIDVPVSLLDASNDGILAMDHLGGATTGEPIVCGLESGHVEVHHLLHGSSRPLKPQLRYKAHTGWVTQTRYAPELSGVITCSLDESAAVIDVEKGAVLQRMIVDRKPKPLFHFDYHRFHNVLTTCGGRSVHVWNALTGARLASLPEHDAPVVRTSINASKWQLYVLTEDKTIKVWDLRTYKPLDSVCDEITRYPSNTLSVLHWSDKHHMLYSGCTELFGWRPLDVQERLDAGLVATTRTFAGHLRPINQMLLLPQFSHLIAFDAQTTIIWGTTTGQKLGQWRWAVEEEDRIMCVTTDLAATRLLVGTEHGMVAFLNYASGAIISRLHHSEGRSEITCVSVVQGVSSDAPPIAYAGTGNLVLMWTVDRNNEKDLTSPFSSYRIANDHGMVLAIAMADAERQVVVCSTSNGYYLLLTIGLAPLSLLSTGINPAEHLVVSSPGIFFGCHADGIVRMMGLNSKGYDFYELCSFSASHDADDPISAICLVGDRLIVGDAGGYVSVFRVTKLVDHKLLRYHIIPKAATGDLSAASSCLDDVRLLVSFKGHSSSITGVGVVGTSLVTCSTDRHIRVWQSFGIGEISKEFGRDDIPHGFERHVETKTHSFHSTDYSTIDSHFQSGMVRQLSFANNLAVARSRQSVLGENMFGIKTKMLSPSSNSSSSPLKRMASLSILERDEAKLCRAASLPPLAMMKQSRTETRTATPEPFPESSEDRLFKLACRPLLVHSHRPQEMPFLSDIQDRVLEVTHLRHQKAEEGELGAREAPRVFSKVQLPSIAKPLSMGEVLKRKQEASKFQL